MSVVRDGLRPRCPCVKQTFTPLRFVSALCYSLFVIGVGSAHLARMPPGREFTRAELDELLESMAGETGSIQLSFLLQQESGPNVQQAFIKDSLDSSLAITFECAGGNTGTDVEECERTAAKMAGAFGGIKHVWSGGDSIVHLFEAAKPLPVVDWEAVSNATVWDVGAAGLLSAAVHQASAECHVTVEAHRVVLSGASPPHEPTVFSRHAPTLSYLTPSPPYI